MTDDLLAAVNAAERLARLLQQLDQSARMSDFHQLREGLHIEARLVRFHLHKVHEDRIATERAVERDSPGQVRADAPATSRAAARAIRSGSQRAKVLMFLAGTRGRTDFEIQYHLGLSPSSERPRRGELVSLGLVTPTGDTREHSGLAWTVWTLTRMGEGVAQRIGNGERSVAVEPMQQTDQSTQDTHEPDPALF